MQLIDVYDRSLRGGPEVRDAAEAVQIGPVWAARYRPTQGFVTYHSLAGLSAQDLDALVTSVVDHFRAIPEVRTMEWKTRGHDGVPDLDAVLRAHGFVPDDPESVLMGSARELARPRPLPAGVTLHRVDPHADNAWDQVMTAVRTAARVFGDDPSEDADRATELLTNLRSGRDEELWWAECDGRAVCSGRISGVDGTEVAGIWGGATSPEYRGRGIYRALTAARAETALRWGKRYVHSDSTDDSRVILERSGFQLVTTSTPYNLELAPAS